MTWCRPKAGEADENSVEAAKALGISRRTLLYKLHHLRETGHRVDPE